MHSGRMSKASVFVLVALGFLTGAVLLAPSPLRPAEKIEVRQPTVAGSFYPADPKELGKMIDGFLARAGDGCDCRNGGDGDGPIHSWPSASE